MDQTTLCIASIAGDDDAFYKLLFIHKEQLYKIAYSYLKSEQEALEAVQETTYRAYKNIKKLRNVEYFRTWLIRILINYCIDEQKRLKRTSPLKLDINASEDADNSIEIRYAIEQLEPKYKSIVILKYFEDMTINDIANIMERPVGTIKTWLNQALKQLRKMLSEEVSNYVQL